MAQFLRRAADWLARHKRGLFQSVQLVLGFGVWEGFNLFYDIFIFSAALLALGPVWGAVAATTGAFAVNAFVYWLYEYMRVDWLQAKKLSELADKENKTTFEKLITLHRERPKDLRGRVIADFRLAMLTVAIDPVILAVYYRNNHFKGLTQQDWYVLFRTTLIACFMWLLKMEPAVFFGKLIWHTIFG